MGRWRKIVFQAELHKPKSRNIQNMSRISGKQTGFMNKTFIEEEDKVLEKQIADSQELKT